MEILGTWIRYDVNRVDASQIVTRDGHKDYYHALRISKDEFCITQGEVRRQTCYDAAYVNKQFIVLPTQMVYRLERFDADTLIFHEELEGLSPDKLNRYAFARRESFFAEGQVRMEDEVAYLTPQQSPIYTKDLHEDLAAPMKRSIDEAWLYGKAIIDFNAEEVDVVVLDIGGFKRQDVNYFTKMLIKSLPHWYYPERDIYPVVNIPFYLAKKYFKSGMDLGRIELFPITDDAFPVVSGESSGQAKQAFAEGVAALRENQLDMAIACFTRCYEKNYANLDALYNRAAVYRMQGKMDMACQDYQLLWELGQVGGRKLLRKFCNQE